jgi:hypothetical protein
VRSSILKSDAAIDRAGDIVGRALKHLYHALYIATYYAAGREATAAGLVGPDGLPNGAMTFLHDNEMVTLLWLAQALGRMVDLAKSGADQNARSRVKMSIDCELLRYLAETMRTVDLQGYFRFVMENTANRRSVVSEWRDALRNAMPTHGVAEARLRSRIEEIQREGGREAAAIATARR